MPIRDDDPEVGDQLDEVPGQRALIQRRGGGVEEQQDDIDDHCWKDHQEVGLELVLHGHALGAGGGDGGVGDEGQVVAEHGTAHNGAADHGHGHAGDVGDLDADGHQGGDRAHGGAHGKGQDAADDEDAGQDHAGRQQLQAQIGSGGHRAHGIGHAGEDAGFQEDEEHQDQRVISAALAEAGDQVIKAHGVLILLPHGAEDERADDGDQDTGIQRHRAGITGQDGGNDVQDDEDDQWQ